MCIIIITKLVSANLGLGRDGKGASRPTRVPRVRRRLEQNEAITVHIFTCIIIIIK